MLIWDRKKMIKINLAIIKTIRQLYFMCLFQSLEAFAPSHAHFNSNSNNERTINYLLNLVDLLRFYNIVSVLYNFVSFDWDCCLKGKLNIKPSFTQAL